MNLIRLAIAGSLAILQYACAAMPETLPAPPGSNATAAQHNSEGTIGRSPRIISRPLSRLIRISPRPTSILGSRLIN